MIRIEFNDRDVNTAITDLQLLLRDLTPVMERIADTMRDATKDRFDAQTSPEGVPWAKKKQSTIDRQTKGKRGADPRPLHYSLDLRSQIFATSGPDFAEVGSNRAYAAMMHFGGQKEKFPHLWGDIPARPFLGLSEEDRGAILEIVAEWFTRASGGNP